MAATRSGDRGTAVPFTTAPQAVLGRSVQGPRRRTGCPLPGSRRGGVGTGRTGVAQWRAGHDASLGARRPPQRLRPPIRVFTPDAGKTLGGRGRRPWSDEPRRVQRGSVLPGSGLRRGSLLMVEISEVGGGRFRQKPCGGSWLDQSTHSGVPTPTSSEPRHGARLRISSFLNRRSSPVPTCSGPPRPAPVAAAARSCADYFGDFPQRGPRLRRRQRAGR